MTSNVTNASSRTTALLAIRIDPRIARSQLPRHPLTFSYLIAGTSRTSTCYSTRPFASMSLPMSLLFSDDVPTHHLSFDGQTRKLVDFLQEFENAAFASQLDDQQMCKSVIRYIRPRLDKELWKSLPGFRTAPYDWDTFRSQIIAEYPGALASHISFDNLVSIARTQYGQTVRTLDDVCRYGQMYRTVLNRLKACDADPGISAAALFLKGFDVDARKKIMLNLQIKYPNRAKSFGYTVDEIYGAAQHEFSDKYDPLNLVGQSTSLSQAANAIPALHTPVVALATPPSASKPEPFTTPDVITSLTNTFALQLQEQTKAITALTNLVCQSQAPASLPSPLSFGPTTNQSSQIMTITGIPCMSSDEVRNVVEPPQVLREAAETSAIEDEFLSLGLVADSLAYELQNVYNEAPCTAALIIGHTPAAAPSVTRSSIPISHALRPLSNTSHHVTKPSSEALSLISHTMFMIETTLPNASAITTEVTETSVIEGHVVKPSLEAITRSVDSMYTLNTLADTSMIATEVTGTSALEDEFILLSAITDLLAHDSQDTHVQSNETPTPTSEDNKSFVTSQSALSLPLVVVDTPLALTPYVSSRASPHSPHNVESHNVIESPNTYARDPGIIFEEPITSIDESRRTTPRNPFDKCCLTVHLPARTRPKVPDGPFSHSKLAGSTLAIPRDDIIDLAPFLDACAVNPSFRLLLGCPAHDVTRHASLNADEGGANTSLQAPDNPLHIDLTCMGDHESFDSAFDVT